MSKYNQFVRICRHNFIFVKIDFYLLSKQDCFIVPGPPYFFMSLQYTQSPQSSLKQATHSLHLTLLTLLADGGRLYPGLPSSDLDLMYLYINFDNNGRSRLRQGLCNIFWHN